MQARSGTQRASYDDLAEDYDQHWSIHVREPQARLTRELALRAGLRCADLGCGTGLDTLEMARAVAPGEVVAVDCSRAMLDSALARAAGSNMVARCEDAGAFILGAERASFDVVTLRFSLGYLDWRSLLPRLPALLRDGGRLGILTILASSAPQAYATYAEMARSLGIALVSRSAPETLDDIERGLSAGGGVTLTRWLHSFRLQFASGEQLARFLRVSGMASHPLIDQLSPLAAQVLWKRFAECVEAQREGDGIPLDFHLGGFTATRA